MMSTKINKKRDKINKRKKIKLLTPNSPIHHGYACLVYIIKNKKTKGEEESTTQNKVKGIYFVVTKIDYSCNQDIESSYKFIGFNKPLSLFHSRKKRKNTNSLVILFIVYYFNSNTKKDDTNTFNIPRYDFNSFHFLSQNYSISLNFTKIFIIFMFHKL